MTAKKQYQLSCQVCGIGFLANGLKAKTCSPECAIAFNSTINRLTDCWEKQHKGTQGGYCNTSFRSEVDYSHRFSYRHLVGPIPEGQVVRHKCDNPKCCNPDHLEIGTYHQNMEDMRSRGRSAVGTRNARSKLSEEQVRDIATSDEDYNTLGRKYSVHPSNIRSIKNGNTWSHVTGIKKDAV
jgi:hypothetical protein